VTGTGTVIEAGPGRIRRLCGDAGDPTADTESAQSALDAVDDPVALVDGQPVAVDALWRSVFESLILDKPAPVVIVYPSWWTTARIARVTEAARAVSGEVITHQRAWLLATAAPEAGVVVEIAPRLVLVAGIAAGAEPRTGEPHRVAAAVARRVVSMTPHTPGAVVIDAPSTVDGAVALASMIADRLRDTAGPAVEIVDDARLELLAAARGQRHESEPPAPESRCRRGRALAGFSAAAAVLTAVVCGGVGTGERRDAPTAAETTPMTSLIEGRITLQVPAQWPAQRVVTGPGSARVVLASPANPHVALHVTQSPVPDETLGATAESLARAIAAEPAGVFVEFDPAGRRAGRPAVTYREVRTGHDIEWTIVLDDAVRISIGCQSPRGDETVREVCEQAVRSARRLG
jgi:type VII secretion-associated protein (TIGR03931 family)